MSGGDTALAGVLEPVRDIAIGQLMRELARALEAGADVRQEPMIRDREDRVLREGALHLPRRADLAVTVSGQTTIRQVKAPGTLSFDPLEVVRPGLVAIIRPFAWDAARLLAETEASDPNWTPLRLWFLEAFQSRYGELAPDFDGAVHALRGPQATGPRWTFLVDFGSAPVSALSELIDAFANCGVKRLLIGDTEPVTNGVGLA